MLRVPLHKVESGMVLARPIVSPWEPSRYLLQRNVEVSLDVVPRLRQLGVTEIWIRHRELEFLEDLIDEDLSECQRVVYCQVRRNFEAIMRGSTPGIDAGRFQAAISELFDYLKRNAAGNILLQKLDAFDNYLMSHSTNVCYLSLLLGLKLEDYLIRERTFKSPREAKDIQLLGLGCLLHDIGKMRVPPEILNKPGRLTPEEMEVVKLHPVYGHEMARDDLSPVAAEVILNHHQRFAGGGYPQRADPRTGEPLPSLSGKQISIFSRIATVADVYDAATTARCYSAAKPPVQALFEMGRFCRGFFDPVVEAAFRQIIPPFPLGQVVRLNNGVEAVVVDFNPRRPTRPKVQALKDPRGAPRADPSLEEIDLAFHDDLHIAFVDDVDVRPFQPELLAERPSEVAEASA